MSKDNSILIRKASGEEEVFSIQKLEKSLIKAGAGHETIQHIVRDINEWVFPGATTKQIYGRAFSILNKKRDISRIRYRLKQAILQLGPTGYPFENLIGEIFKKKGYETEVGIVVNGQCVTHEMDVIATMDKVQNLVECKYHKDQGKQVSVQVPLYVHSRVDDIANTRRKLPEYHNVSFTAWVVTNTRFSSDSINYSKCSGLKLLAWDYPENKGLKDIIEELKLYPVTILRSLTLKQKNELLELGIVTCSQLSDNPTSLDSFNFSNRKLKAIMTELQTVCT